MVATSVVCSGTTPPFRSDWNGCGRDLRAGKATVCDRVREPRRSARRTPLLSALVGDQAVTTVEFDPALAAQARTQPVSCRIHTHVIHGDVAAGCDGDGPYERIVAAFSVDRIPPDWLTQTLPGGRVVTPWTSAWCRYGTLALTVDGHRAAHGRFHPFASFMPMRSTPAEHPGAQHAAGAAEAEARADGGTTTETSLSPWAVAGGDLDSEFRIGLGVPGAWFAWDTSGSCGASWVGVCRKRCRQSWGGNPRRSESFSPGSAL